MSRCQWIAEGLLLAREAGDRTNLARLATVEDHLRRNGVDLERPYLNPGSSDRYEFPPSRARVRSNVRPAALLSAASTIGDWLVDQAIPIGDQTIWLSPDSWPPYAHGFRSSALGPDFHSGTSGIALFLAEWSRASSNETARHLAIGAARHALTLAATTAGWGRAGIDHGWRGVALAGARVGLLLDEPKLVHEAERLIGRLELEAGRLGQARLELEKEDARPALTTVARRARQSLMPLHGDLSLAQGLAGDAELLLCRARNPQQEIASEDRLLPMEIAANIIRHLGLLTDEPWLTLSHLPLGLMSGLAGVGYLFLRLRDPAIPSVLTPCREALEIHSGQGSKFSVSQTSGS